MISRSVILAAVSAAMLVFAVPARASVVITIDKSIQKMTVSVDGVRRYTWPVSTGRAGYATPSGSFTPFRLEEDHYSKEWDDAPMPHSIFFTQKGHAIHGSFETKRLGTPASHGCVRLAPSNAETLFELVKSEGLGNTKVVLTGQAPAMIARRPAQREAAREPLELQQYQSRYPVQPGYQQPSYGPQYQQPYGYGQSQTYGQQQTYGQSQTYGTYGQPQVYRQPQAYGQAGRYDQPRPRSPFGLFD